MLLAAAAALAGCRRRPSPPVDAAPLTQDVAIAADAEGEVLYVDLSGAVRRAAGVASVPSRSRHVVAVEGPDGPGGAVWLADVSAPAPAWPAHRGTVDELERRGLAALPPGAASRVTFPTLDGSATAPAPAGVVVYGATWCAACGDARAWLDAHRVAYTFRNVELDTAAALDAAALCASYDITADRIPVIDLAGKLVVGFDPTRLATILGASL